MTKKTFKNLSKGCPWRLESNKGPRCQGTGGKHCIKHNCPVMYWITVLGLEKDPETEDQNG